MKILIAKNPDADIFGRAVKYFVENLFSPIDKCGVKIDIKFGNLERGARVIKKGEKSFEITIANVGRIDGQLFSLAHEIAHVKQFIRGELTQIGQAEFWKGVNVSGLDYLSRPHEVEATSFAAVLVRSFIFCS